MKYFNPTLLAENLKVLFRLGMEVLFEVKISLSRSPLNIRDKARLLIIVLFFNFFHTHINDIDGPNIIELLNFKRSFL